MQILTRAGPGALPPQDSCGSHDNGHIHLHILPLITGTSRDPVFLGLFPSHQRTFQCSPPRTRGRPCTRSKPCVSPLPQSPWHGAAAWLLPTRGATGSCWHPESSITAATFLRALRPLGGCPRGQKILLHCVPWPLPCTCFAEGTGCLPSREKPPKSVPSSQGRRGGSGEMTQKMTFHRYYEGQENAGELIGAGR